MDAFITKIKTNLNGVLQMTQIIDGIMMTGDDRANQIIVELHRDRDPYEIPQGTKIVGYFMRSDGVTLEIDGSVIDTNQVKVVIPALAYQIPGVLSIAIRMFVGPSQEDQRGYYTTATHEFILVTDPNITEGPDGEPILTRTTTVYTNKTVIAAASCFVQITETDTIIEPGHLIPDVQDVIVKLAEMDAKDVAFTAAEALRVSGETARIAAESARESAETARATAENARNAAESARVIAESARAVAEDARVLAESARNDAEEDREDNELARQTAEQTRQAQELARQAAIQNMTVSATGLGYDASPTATISDVNGHKHIQFGLVPGKPFSIKRTFASVAEMNAYAGSDVELYELVVIASNVDDPDNSKMYMKVPNGWQFITDLSGAQGIQGPQGIQGIQGVSVDNAVLNANYTLTIHFSDGTTYTTPSIRGEKGEIGNTGVGITGAALNDNDTITIYFSDGTSYTTPRSMRGPKGEPGEGGVDIDYDAGTGKLTVMFG